MIKLLKYFLIVCLSVVVLDVANRICCDYIFQNVSSKSQLASIYKFNTIDNASDIVILGASKAIHHYNPNIIHDETTYDCYNYGYNGTSIIYQYLCAKRALQNGHVKYFILDISEAQLCDEWVNNRLSLFFPYYWINDDVYSILNEEITGLKKISLYSSFVQYNSLPYDVIKGFLKSNNSVRGYESLPYTGKEFIPNSKMLVDTPLGKWAPCPQGVKYLQLLSEYIKNEGARLIVCLSPTMTKSSEFTSFILDFCENEHLTVWDLRYLEATSKDNRLFNDEMHLNERGAELFSKEVARLIRDL